MRLSRLFLLFSPSPCDYHLSICHAALSNTGSEIGFNYTFREIASPVPSNRTSYIPSRSGGERNPSLALGSEVPYSGASSTHPLSTTPGTPASPMYVSTNQRAQFPSSYYASVNDRASSNGSGKSHSGIFQCSHIKAKHDAIFNTISPPSSSTDLSIRHPLISHEADSLV
ncbi:unnamed protein product [Protopolystoma xenopodis]|uniref:Uncharacterized protein n=1 Tax=Protopolystoma xenopodis TaxID=117903 RepID=A0A3S5CVM1_9PLAT|nr:unnamed protein product [Protopolystoma xenopodis]